MLSLLASLWMAGPLLSGGPVLHWKFNEGTGKVAKDASGHGIEGRVSASWVDAPAGQALHFDGASGHYVVADIPPEYRLGKGSWTVSAWIRPDKFTFESRQSQRRLFGCGKYPQSYLCVDLLASGSASLYECWESQGRTGSAGADSSVRLALNKWAFLAVAFDRQGGWIQMYVNGVLRAKQRVPAGFDADLSQGGEFTVGSGWQNYWGDAAEVKLFNRVESWDEIKAEFHGLNSRFKVIPTQEEERANRRDELERALELAEGQWAKRDFAAVQKTLAGALAHEDGPADLRSHLQLVLAKSYVASGSSSKARSEYSLVAANTAYPEVNRMEARELVIELDRSAKGLPARDPKASQVRVASLPPVRKRIYVSPSGNDWNVGTLRQPLATISAARDRVRDELAKPGKGTIEVDLVPGEYRLTGSLHLEPHDSGRPDSPVVYRALKPGTATLYGGKGLRGFRPVVDPSILSRLPVESRGKVVQLDLHELGITNYGALAVRGFGQPPSPPTLELYINGKPQTLARWPNKGFVAPTKLVDPGDTRTGAPSVLGYSDDRHARWTKAEDPWIFGYFQFLWADGTAKIAKIDSTTKTLTTAAPYHYATTGMTMEQGIKYYAFNLLEEMDVPGEWYLNRNSGVLYLYPPSDLNKSTVDISMLDTPMIVGNGLSNIRFEGLTFDLGRGDGVILKSSHDCQLVGCTVSRFGGTGVSVQGGHHVTLMSCDVFNTGRRATEVIGGDRETLTPGGHVVANCVIHDFGRIDRTYTPGVQLEGVGNRVVHNLFYNCPSSALRIEGNDHDIEYNEVHHVLLESDDQGAMELFGNPTYRGVVFKHNYFHDLGSGDQDKLVAGQAGIRLDDAISGMLIYGNLFVRAANGAFGGVQMNSGRDNWIVGNVFADSERGISGGCNAGNQTWVQFGGPNRPASFIMNPLYLKRYPELARILNEEGMNFVWRNAFYQVKRDMTGNLVQLETIGNHVYDNNRQGFVDPTHGDFRTKAKTGQLEAMRTRAIPFSEIGPYLDAWRTKKPSR